MTTDAQRVMATATQSAMTTATQGAMETIRQRTVEVAGWSVKKCLAAHITFADCAF